MLCIIKNNLQVRKSWRKQMQNCIHWKWRPFSFWLQWIRIQGNHEYIWKISSPCLPYFCVSSSLKSLGIRLILEALSSQGLVFDREICWAEEKLSSSEILSWVRVSARIVIWVWKEVKTKWVTGQRCQCESAESLWAEGVLEMCCVFLGVCFPFIISISLIMAEMSNDRQEMKKKNKGRLGVSVN